MLRHVRTSIVAVFYERSITHVVWGVKGHASAA
jgi:hypothetical protein